MTSNEILTACPRQMPGTQHIMQWSEDREPECITCGHIQHSSYSYSELKSTIFRRPLPEIILAEAEEVQRQLDIPAAVRYLGETITGTRLRKHWRLGHIPGTVIGRAIYFTPEDLDRCRDLLTPW